MAREREKFGAEELAIVLSHWDLGIVKRIQEFPRGSRRAPKMVLDCEQGRVLLKRRAHGKDDLPKVAFTHKLKINLQDQNFPLPRLFPIRDNDSSMLVWNEKIYELFEFIEGTTYDMSVETTFSAGRILGLFHKLLMGFECEYQPPRGSYHGAEPVRRATRGIMASLPLDKRPPKDVVEKTIDEVARAYDYCAQEVEDLGLESWDEQIVHGDWHPGNMLFRDKRVVAVIDYDAARKQQRVIDLANGAIQFSILGGGEDPGKWPERLDEERLKQFITGYDSVNVISVAELRAIPLLMCEAMIAEAVLPIAATGSFGRLDGYTFLETINRKCKWILANHSSLEALMDE